MHNIRDLLDASPSEEVKVEVNTLVRQHEAKHNLDDTSTIIRIRRAGRLLYIEVRFDITGQTRSIKDILLYAWY